MKKTLLVALAAVALPLAGCADNEAADALVPATDAPVVEEPAVVEEPLATDSLALPEAEMTTDPMMDEPMTEEGVDAPTETPATDGTMM